MNRPLHAPLFADLTHAVQQDRLQAVLTGFQGRMITAVFTPNGIGVVTATDDNMVRLWEATTGKPLAVLSGHDQWVHSAAFSPDCARVVTASSDKTARLWDVALGVTIAIFEDASLAAFDPSGERVVTAAGNTAQIWPVPVRSAAERLSAVHMCAPRALTDQEKRATFLDQGEDIDPVFGPLKPTGDPAEHQRLAERFEQGQDGAKPDLAQALYHHALAARLYGLQGKSQETDYETARRTTIARQLSLHDAAAVWQRLMADGGGMP